MAEPIKADELATLLRQHSSALCLFARQWTNSPEDCVQEALIELATIEQRPENVVAWLYKVVRNRALNENRAYWRRKRREQRESVPVTHIDARSAVESAEEQDRLYQALEQLPDAERELIVLRIWSGLNWREIGDITGIPISTVHRHYSKALQTIKRKLESTCSTNPK